MTVRRERRRGMDLRDGLIRRLVSYLMEAR
jgi:hypothetical protein